MHEPPTTARNHSPSGLSPRFTRLDRSIFGRYLDLSPLKDRTSGLVRCIFHDDHTASLSLDLEGGIWHCFGCGQQGGIKRFAVAVGEVATEIDTRPEPIETAWLSAMRRAKRQPWSDEAVWRTYQLADWVRQTRKAVAEVRRMAGDDTPETWALLARAAHLETVADHVEAELDEVMG